jgi:hypothetical protein
VLLLIAKERTSEAQVLAHPQSWLRRSVRLHRLLQQSATLSLDPRISTPYAIRGQSNDNSSCRPYFDSSSIHPNLVCGGSGTRLRQLSRKSNPKLFSSRLMGEDSLFQASPRRFSGSGFAAAVVVTGDPFRFVVTEQLAAAEFALAGSLIVPESRIPRLPCWPRHYSWRRASRRR